jgi:hypothetical protein
MGIVACRLLSFGPRNHLILLQNFMVFALCLIQILWIGPMAGRAACTISEGGLAGLSGPLRMIFLQCVIFVICAARVVRKHLSSARKSRWPQHSGFGAIFCGAWFAKRQMTRGGPS